MWRIGPPNHSIFCPRTARLFVANVCNELADVSVVQAGCIGDALPTFLVPTLRAVRLETEVDYERVENP
jgi:hypothetical protein